MTALLRRALGALVLSVVAGLLVASPAAANLTVSGTITISGDTTTAVNGTAWFMPEPSTGSYGGVYVTDGTFSTDGFPDGGVETNYKIRIQLSTMDNTSRYYREGFPEGTADPDLATVVPLGGPTPTPPPAIDIDFPQIARVSGRVTNGDGAPMAGVTVFRIATGSGSPKSAPPTDADGKYAFGYVRAGSHSIVVNAQGDWAGAQQNVTVPASGTLAVDLVMPKAASITGVLTDADSGDPIPYLQVQAYRVADKSYVNGDLTDALGHYDIGGLGTGDFVLSYFDSLGGYPYRFNGGALIFDSAPHLTTTAGAALTHDEALTQSADPGLATHTLSGVVSDDPAHPLAGIDVTARDGSGNTYSTTTDRSGRWAINAPDGSYRIGVQQGSALTGYTSDLVPWFPEFYPDAWSSSAATPVVVAGSVSVDGLDMVLGRAARLTTVVKGPSGTTDLNAGYRVVDAATGVTVLERAPGPYDGNVLQVLVRPGTWKLLVSGRRGTAANDPQLLSRWYGGASSFAAAGAVTLAAGEDLPGLKTFLPGKLKATTAPRVKGTPRVGKTLTATRGAWNLMTDTTFKYRWKRGRTVLSRAASYVVRRADAGATLGVRVTATNGELSTSVTLKVAIRR